MWFMHYVASVGFSSKKLISEMHPAVPAVRLVKGSQTL